MGQSRETLIRASTGTYMLEKLAEQRVPTPRPAPQYLMRYLASVGGDVPEPMGAESRAALAPIPLIDVVIKLLDRAAEVVDSDGATAKYAFDRRAQHCDARVPLVLSDDEVPWSEVLVGVLEHVGHRRRALALAPALASGTP